MMLPPHYVELSRSLGISLASINIGSREVAFSRDIALDALKKLDGTTVAVLGGDVLRISAGKLEYAYANWCCNKLDNECQNAYAERSRCEARAYIEGFQGIGGFDPLFVLVLSESDSGEKR